MNFSCMLFFSPPWGYQNIMLKVTTIRNANAMQNRTMVDLQCIVRNSKYFLYLSWDFFFHALSRTKRLIKRARGDSEKLLKREQIVVQTKHSLTPLMVSIYRAPTMSTYLWRFYNDVYEKCMYHCYCYVQQLWRVVIFISMIEKTLAQGHKAGKW